MQHWGLECETGASPVHCSCDSGRRHAGLALSASWQRAAEERYDDVWELIDREKSRFLAWEVG